jgi:RNA polymerase-binding transcription factor DksA
MASCSFCFNDIEAERLEVLPKTNVCSKCSHSAPGANEKMHGAMQYDHKTSASLVVMESRAFTLYKKVFVRVGQSTNLKRV